MVNTQLMFKSQSDLFATQRLILLLFTIYYLPG